MMMERKQTKDRTMLFGKRRLNWVTLLIVLNLTVTSFASLETTQRCPQCYSQASTLTVTVPPLPAETFDVIVSPGLSLFALAEDLSKKHVINYPWLFLFRAWLSGQRKHIQAGQYRFSKDMTHKQVLDALCLGHVVIHKVTIPEGVTVAMAVKILQKNPCLRGSIASLPREGHILPGTYTFLSGETRQNLLQRTTQALKKTLKTCPLPAPLQDKESLLILASIVEKETRLASEKGLIAGVFLKRLHLKMRLQADPTVVYGLTQGRGKMGRLLTRADLKIDTSYNTYLHAGLPPTPICCPGADTLRAVAASSPGIYLFFVADGHGGHSFSTHLAEHNQQNLKRKNLQSSDCVINHKRSEKDLRTID